MVEEPPQLPVYIVTCSNWTIEVPLDAYNAQFSKEAQMDEAATRALEAYELKREDIRIVMNPESRDENPKVGTTVLVHLKGTNPDDALVVCTHTCLGNTGLYKKAAVVEKLFNEQVAEMRKRQKEQETKQTKLEEEIKNFEQFQQEVKKNTKARKPRKPKDNEPI